MAKIKKDEDKLRERIVSALEVRFTKQDPEQIVKDVHGGGEYGLDIEFYVRDFFGELQCYGMQIKAGNLTCVGRPNKNVKEIIGQLAIASGKKSIRQANSEYDFSGFFVVVEGSISPIAEGYIRSAFNNSKPIFFLCGEKLELFLKQYEPKNITKGK